MNGYEEEAQTTTRGVQPTTHRKLFQSLGITTWAHRSFRAAMGFYGIGTNPPNQPTNEGPHNEFSPHRITWASLQPLQGELNEVINQGFNILEPPCPEEAEPSYWATRGHPSPNNQNNQPIFGPLQLPTTYTPLPIPPA